LYDGTEHEASGHKNSTPRRSCAKGIWRGALRFGSVGEVTWTPFILHVLVGDGDMNTKKRYVHPSDADILEAIRTGHKNGHSPKIAASEAFEEMTAIQ
jgi:hypothetical protein